MEKTYCELCGKEGDLVDAIVEGVIMGVCLNCSNHGNVVAINQPVVEKKIKMVEEDKKAGFIEVIVRDFAQRIKKARERKNLKQENLAKDIAEKESVIHQLESGKLKPNFKLAKKLEIFLNISLVEKVETNPELKKDINFEDSSLTIGDVLKNSEEE
jgi:putative transcription factor